MSNSQTSSNGIIYRDGKSYMLCGSKEVEIRIIKAGHDKGSKGVQVTRTRECSKNKYHT